MAGPALFQETQRFVQNPWALAGLVAALVGCGAGWFVARTQGDPFHPAGALGIAIGGAVAALLAFGGLHTEVRPDGLYLRLFPLTRQHHFPWHEILRAEARTYRPILDYGGWGIRWGRGGKAYNVYGKRGVQLVLADGRRLLVGSQRADDLAAAIAAARSAPAS